MEKHNPHGNPPAYTDIMHASTNAPNAPPMMPTMANVPNYAVSGSWCLISCFYLSLNVNSFIYASIVEGIADHSYAVPGQTYPPQSYVGGECDQPIAIMIHSPL